MKFLYLLVLFFLLAVQINANDQLAPQSSFDRSNSSRAKFTRVITGPRRLQHSERALAVLVDQEFHGKNPVVYDIGIGWTDNGEGASGPVTTVSLANTLAGKASVIGLDNQIPFYKIEILLESGDVGLTLFYDENDRLIDYETPLRAGLGLVIGDSLEEYDKEYQEMGVRIRNNAKVGGAETHAEIMLGRQQYQVRMQYYDLGVYKKSNLDFMKADMFQMNKGASLNMPKAHIVRIANVFLHYDLKDIGPALVSLHPFVQEGGYVMIGRSEQGYLDRNGEEYLTYKKVGSRFVLDSYSFSLDYGYYDGEESLYLFFGPGDIHRIEDDENDPLNSPSNLMTLTFRQWIRNSATYKTYLAWRSVNKNISQSPDKINQALSHMQALAQVLMEQLKDKGLKAEAYGSMVQVRIESPSKWHSFGAGNKFMDEIKKSFIDKGAPVVVDASTSNIAQTATIWQRAWWIDRISRLLNIVTPFTTRALVERGYLEHSEAVLLLAA